MVYCIHRQHYQWIGFYIKDGSKDRDSRMRVERDIVLIQYTVEAKVNVSYLVILKKETENKKRIIKGTVYKDYTDPERSDNNILSKYINRLCTH